MMAPYLLPDGYRRPPLVALLREGTLATEAGRLAVRRRAERRARRRLPYAARPAVRAVEPVLLIPGFLAGDWTLHEMSAALRAKGFRTYRSHIHANIGCALDAAALIEAGLERIAERRGARVQVVGHSLGGLIARGIAVRRPDLVSGIVTLGSPMRAPAAHHLLLSGGLDLLRRLSRVGVPGLMSDECIGGSCAELSFGETQQPLAQGVEMTNIYSRRDGIVDWRACIDPCGTAVEVRGSHIGMALDPRVIDQVLLALHRQSDVGRSVEVDAGETA